jgi:sterol desaturase/sphingolipid hydroxylase (fatty acid hydroxylase superfamily)
VPSWIEIARGVAAVPLSPQFGIWWGYLCSAALLAAGVYLAARRRGRAPTGGLARFVLSPGTLLHRSSRHDAAMFVINTLLYSLVFLGPLQALSGSLSTATWGLCAAWFGPSPDPSPVLGAVLAGAATLGGVMVADLAFFLSHTLQHRVRWLWVFHQVHHSAPVLVPWTVLRRHPVDVLIDGALAGLLLGPWWGMLAWVAGTGVSPIQILGVNALLFTFLLFGFALQHSHVWLRFGPLEAVFISPAAHQIHHSTALEHRDRNLGNVFSLWDRLAGTYVAPGRRRRLTFGVEPAGRFDRLWALYLRPFVELVRAPAVPDSAPPPGPVRPDAKVGNVSSGSRD